jgi:hypothetical protein
LSIYFENFLALSMFRWVQKSLISNILKLQCVSVCLSCRAGCNFLLLSLAAKGKFETGQGRGKGRVGTGQGRASRAVKNKE